MGRNKKTQNYAQTLSFVKKLAEITSNKYPSYARYYVNYLKEYSKKTQTNMFEKAIYFILNYYIYIFFQRCRYKTKVLS